jgi:glycosyltransferase involved in cell wall biosynthesis
MRIVQLMASPFIGGPERQVLGLAEALRPAVETVFLSFSERGRARELLDEAGRRGFEAIELRHNAPRLWGAAGEVAEHVRRTGAEVICTNGYKPDIIGWLAARRAGAVVVATAHGWTGATWKVRLNEALDRWVMRRMDAVVSVSAAQAVKVRKAGVAPRRSHVIRNAVDAAAFENTDLSARWELESLFPRTPRHIVAACGRLSPEKGLSDFVAAAARALHQGADAGFVLFGDGPLRAMLEQQVRDYGLEKRFVLAGFRPNLNRFLPWCDLLVLPSYTEGLPVVVLEALASGVAVVATAVGGTPEVITDGVQGRLVPPGDIRILADRITETLADVNLRTALAARGRERVRTEFTFAAQAGEYLRLLSAVTNAGTKIAGNKLAPSASLSGAGAGPAFARSALSDSSSSDKAHCAEQQVSS